MDLSEEKVALLVCGHRRRRHYILQACYAGVEIGGNCFEDFLHSLEKPRNTFLPRASAVVTNSQPHTAPGIDNQRDGSIAQFMNLRLSNFPRTHVVAKTGREVLKTYHRIEEFRAGISLLHD